MNPNTKTKAALEILTLAALWGGLAFIIFGPVFEAKDHPVIATFLGLIWAAVVGTSAVHVGMVLDAHELEKMK